MNIWNAWFDGATKESNPGLRGIGGVLKGPLASASRSARALGLARTTKPNTLL